jgi:hypothetical protein
VLPSVEALTTNADAQLDILNESQPMQHSDCMDGGSSGTHIRIYCGAATDRQDHRTQSPDLTTFHARLGATGWRHIDSNIPMGDQSSHVASEAYERQIGPAYCLVLYDVRRAGSLRDYLVEYRLACHRIIQI